MVKISAVYQGEKHCLAKHEPSQSVLETDAPKDNKGRGEKFSPTDLVATALGTCILTTISILAEQDGISILGATVSVEKEMASNPRRISSLKTMINLPNTVPVYYREKIKTFAENCPVKKSLHTDIQAMIDIKYDIIL